MARCVFRRHIFNNNKNGAILGAVRLLQESPVQRTFISSKKLSIRSFSTSLHDHINKEAIAQTNAAKSSLVDIQQTADGRGWGLFARQDIEKGQQVFCSKALTTTSERDDHSVQTGWNKHATMNLPAILVNHCCQANVGIQRNEFGSYDFYALETIPEHSEVLWDYETCEYEISGFSCSCGAPKCRGVLKGFQSHGDIVSEAYGKKHIAPYLLK